MSDSSLHLDDDFGRDKGVFRRVVYGIFTALLFSVLGAIFLEN